MSDTWNVAVLLIIFSAIIWTMIKRDQKRFPGVFPEQDEPVRRDFQQMSLLGKCRMVENKIIDLKKESLRCSSLMFSSLKSLRMIKETAELVSAEQLLKCEYAIKWLEEPVEKRKL